MKLKVISQVIMFCTFMICATIECFSSLYMYVNNLFDGNYKFVILFLFYRISRFQRGTVQSLCKHFNILSQSEFLRSNNLYV